GPGHQQLRQLAKPVVDTGAVKPAVDGVVVEAVARLAAVGGEFESHQRTGQQIVVGGVLELDKGAATAVGIARLAPQIAVVDVGPVPVAVGGLDAAADPVVEGAESAAVADLAVVGVVTSQAQGQGAPRLAPLAGDDIDDPT